MRRIVNGEGYYHVTSRCALQEFLLGDAEKEMFVTMMRRAERFPGVEVLSYCVMSNHFHILVHVRKEKDVGEAEVRERVSALYGPERAARMFAEWDGMRAAGRDAELARELGRLRARMGDVSQFMKTLKHRSSVWYRSHGGRTVGTIYQGPFHSVLVGGDAESLSTVSAYIDLNPVRARIVEDPKDYRWSGYGAAVAGDAAARRGLSLVYAEGRRPPDFMKAVAPLYRRKLYADGSDAIPQEKVGKVLEGGGRLPWPTLLRCRLRFMTRGFVLGTRQFVEEQFERHRSKFGRRRRTGARKVRRGDGLYAARDIRRNAITA